jgi:hypothetical protein
MTYAEIKAQHAAGIPPNTDPQRAGESWQGYFSRMRAAYLWPDISDGESDGDYVARLVSYKDPVQSSSYAISSLSTISASYALNARSASYALKATTASYALTVAA